MKMHLKIWIPGSTVTRRWLLRMNRVYLLLLCVTLARKLAKNQRQSFSLSPTPSFFFNIS